MSKKINIALVGNPNSGKTTLFNGLTGTRQYVGNWPGVTVEKKEGNAKYNNEDLLVTDLPGIYSLSPYSLEEIIARNYIVDEEPDVVVNVVDASNLERNLYLSIQLIELGKPVIIALNMMDMAEKREYFIDIKKLSDLLGIPIIPMVASKKEGLDTLLKTVLDLSKGVIKYSPNPIVYEKNIENKVNSVMESLKDKAELEGKNLRWLALKIVEGDEKILYSLKIDSIDEVSVSKDISIDDDMESILADSRYDFIANIVTKAVKQPKAKKLTTSDKIDKVLTNKWLGLPIFALIMFSVFYFTFDLVGNRLLDVIDVFFAETLSGWVISGLESIGAAEWLISMIVDGIIGGVGGVLVFLPNIACLFLAITILEGSGYMARVAFIMDRAMRNIGLNGKAFIPMILGFGCNVPAIMGTRTLENENDRLTAILINPFMSCSARLPVYTLFAAAFFPGNEKTVVFSLYLLGILIAVIVGLIFKKTLFKSDGTPFMMELPPYRVPMIKDVLIQVWDKIKGFLVKAGTLIFGVSIVLWFILGFNFSGVAELNSSFGASLGKLFAPIFAPLGFGNWQAALSLMTGIVAKEIVVSNMSIIYGLGEAASSGAFAQALSSSFSQLTAYAFMVFVLLYTPCMATIAVIKRETNSWKWTGFSVLYQFGVAWFVALLVYQIGSLLGF